MDDFKNYKPYQIPEREQLSKNEVPQIDPQTNSKFNDLSGYLPFTEIEMTSMPNEQAISGFKAQPIEPVIDEKRKMFYAMRQIAKMKSSIIENPTKIFYRQALFMKNFEDDYTEQEPFSSYFPSYQAMGYEQLRTYFTWRTRVRMGRIARTSTSYAFLYIYELLHTIGATNPQDGLDKLMDFWKAFRVFDNTIDKYILQWIKDYHVYYVLPKSFADFASEHCLRVHYPTVFAYDSSQNDCFEMLIGISKYDIRKSVFYSEETSQVIHDCFNYIFNRLCQLCETKEMRFENIVFYPIARESAWTPFRRALFYPALEQSDRQVAISEAEVYTCRKNQWVYTAIILSEQGKGLIGYIMKEMEISLRKILHFKHKISSDRIMWDSVMQKKLDSMGISLTLSIKDFVLEFYRDITRTTVVVDAGSVERIRKEALYTQEKLIVIDEVPILIEKMPDVVEMIPITPETSDIWANFKACLVQTELEALAVILQAQDIKSFATKNGIMLEVLVDDINQKAVDCIYDNLLEFSDTVTIYEEYTKKLKEMVGC